MAMGLDQAVHRSKDKHTRLRTKHWQYAQIQLSAHKLRLQIVSHLQQPDD